MPSSILIRVYSTCTFTLCFVKSLVVFHKHVTIVRTIEGAMTLIRVLHQVWARSTSTCSEDGGIFLRSKYRVFIRGDADKFRHYMLCGLLSEKALHF